MSSRREKRRRRWQIRVLIVGAVVVAVLAGSVWLTVDYYSQPSAPAPKPRPKTAQNPSAPKPADKALTIVPAALPAGKLATIFQAALDDAQQRYPDPKEYLERIAELDAVCGDLIDCRTYLDEASSRVLRQDPTDVAALVWRLRLATTDDREAGRETRVNSAWEAVREQAPENLQAMAAYLHFAVTHNSANEKTLQQLLRELKQRRDNFSATLLSLEIEYRLSPEDSKSSLRQQIFALQRRLPKTVAPTTLIRLSRLAVESDPLLIAGATGLVPTGVVRASRLLQNAGANQNQRIILEQAELALMASDWQGAVKLAKQLTMAHADESTTDPLRKLELLINRQRARFLEGVALLMSWRTGGAAVEAEVEASLAAVLLDLRSSLGADNWRVELLAAGALANSGQHDAAALALAAAGDAVPTAWQPFHAFWLGEARWQAGQVEAAIAALTKAATATELAVWSRQRARGWLLRGHLLLGDLESATSDLAAMEGLVQSNRPLDEATLLLTVMRRQLGDDEADAETALARLGTQTDRRLGKRYGAALAAAANRSALASETMAVLLEGERKSVADWLFYLNLVPPASSAATERCEAALPLVADEGLRTHLGLRLQRSPVNVPATAHWILAFAAETAAVRYEVALAERAYGQAFRADQQQLRQLVLRLMAGDVVGAEALLAEVPIGSQLRLVGEAELALATGRPATVLELVPADSTIPEYRSLRRRATIALGGNDGRQARESQQDLLWQHAAIDYSTDFEVTADSVAKGGPAKLLAPRWLLPLLLTQADGPFSQLAYVRLDQQLLAAQQAAERVARSAPGPSGLPLAIGRLVLENRRAEAKALLAATAELQDLQPFEYLQLARAAVLLEDEALAHDYFATAARADASDFPFASIAWLRWAATLPSPPDVTSRLAFEIADLPLPLRQPAAMLAIARGDNQAALPLLDGLPETLTVKRTRAAALVDIDPATARKLCEEVLSLRPRDQRARLLRAQLQQENDAFTAELDRAVRLAGGRIDARLAAARLAVHRQQHHHVRKLLANLQARELTRSQQQAACHLLLAVDDWRQAAVLLNQFPAGQVPGLRFEQAFVVGDQQTMRRLHDRVLNLSKDNAALATMVIRAAWEDRRIEDLQLALQALPEPSAGEPPDLQAARSLAATAIGADSPQPLSQQAESARWVALAAAETSVDHGTAARMAATAIASPSPWRYSDMRSACRVAAKWRLPELDAVLREFAVAAELPEPLRAELKLAVGRELLANGYPTKAKQWLTDSLRLAPTPVGKLLLAQALAASGEELRAEEILKDAEVDDLDGRHEVIRKLIGLQRLARERRRQLVAPYFAAGGVDAAAELLLSLPQWRQSELGLAAQVLEAQIADNGNSELAHRLLMRFQRIAELTDEQHFKVEVAAAEIFRRDGDLPSARKHLVNALSYRATPELNLQLATVCDEMGWHEQAATYRQAAALLLIPR